VAIHDISENMSGYSDPWHMFSLKDASVYGAGFCVGPFLCQFFPRDFYVLSCTHVSKKEYPLQVRDTERHAVPVSRADFAGLSASSTAAR
jgi:hypothetical protein